MPSDSQAVWLHVLRFALPAIPIVLAVRSGQGRANRPVLYAQLSLAVWLALETTYALPPETSLGFGVGMSAVAWLAAVGMQPIRRSARPLVLACIAGVGGAAIPILGVRKVGLDPIVTQVLVGAIPGAVMTGLLGASFHALRPALRRASRPRFVHAIAAFAFAIPTLVTIALVAGTGTANAALSAAFLPIALLLGRLFSPLLSDPARHGPTDPMFIVEAGRGIVHANDSGFRLLQVREGDIHAARAAVASMPELREIVADENRECGEFFTGKNATERRCYEVRANRAEGANGELRVLTIQDVTARKESERRLYHEAHFDSLTGLANRRHFVRRLGEAIDAKGAEPTRAALMLLDLDRFKEVNDTYGHPAGDELLRIIAHRLRQHLRREDFVAQAQFGDSWIARLGGDEFAVLLQGFETREDLERIAQRVLGLVGDPVVLQSRKLWMSGSLGIACYPEDAEDIGDLTARADIALYKAKEGNRSGFCFYEASLTAESQRKASLDRHLRGAIDEGELSLHFQAKVAIESRQIRGAEALLRWHSAEHGTVLPKDFIPVAEEYGFIDRLGTWVIDQTCAQIAAWNREGIQPVPISVNVSSLQFAEDDLLRVIADSLTRHGVDPSLLEIELTESAVLNGDDEKIVRCLEELRTIGVKVALDDFGTGYSALSYLSRVPLDVLKLDRAFVRDIHLDPGSAGVVKAVVAMAHSLELEVVAEGADCVEQLDILLDASCDLVQGFIFGPAVPEPSFRELLCRGTMEVASPGGSSGRSHGKERVDSGRESGVDDDRWSLPQERRTKPAGSSARAQRVPVLDEAGEDDLAEVTLEVDPDDLDGELDIEVLFDEDETESGPDVGPESEDRAVVGNRAPESSEPSPSPTEERYVLVVDDESCNGGLLALRLNRLRFLALYTVAEEAPLLAKQEAARISSIIASTEIENGLLRTLIERVTGQGERATPSVLFIGDEIPSKERLATCSDGHVWVIREPIDDAELIQLVRMATTEHENRSARLRPRAPVDLMTQIWQSGESGRRAGVMTSLSGGGAFIACEAFEVKSIVEVEFTLEDGPLVARAQVLYADEEGEGVGVGFIDLDPADEARIEAAVAARSARCLA